MANWKLKVGMLFDSKEFEQGVQRIDKQLKVLDSELKASQSSVANFGNSTEQLKTKASSLSEKIELQKAKVEGLRKAYEESVTTKGEDANATQNLEIKLNNATTALNNMQRELKDVKNELKQQPDLFKNIESRLDSLDSKIEMLSNKMVSFGTVLTASVTAPLIAMTKQGIEAIIEENTQISKLETILRNTTDATDEQIASYISLMDVKEKNGVVSAEALLSASQEMATYIENIDVLDTMIDVCSDMIAQQYGVNASMEQATNVATGLGKALANGDYSFLTKLGYGFTEAQKEIMKTGTEAERVATIMDVVSDSIGGVNKGLTETTAGKIFQLTTAFGDFQKVLANSVMPIIDKYVPKITELINSFVNLDSETQQGILKMLAFGAATGPALIGLGKLLPVVNNVPKSMSNLISKLGHGSSKVLEFGKSFGGDIISKISVFSSKIASLGWIGEKISNLFAPLGTKISNAFEPIKKIGEKLSPITAKVQQVFSKIGIVANGCVQKLSSISKLAMKLVGPAAVVGLMLAGLGLAQSQFGEQLDQFLTIAIEKAPGIITGFVDMITAEIPRLIPLGVDLLMNLLDVILANVPVLIDGAVAIIVTLAQGVGENVEILLSKILDVIFMLVNKIIDNLPLILQTGLQLLLALTEGIVNNIDKIIDGILNVILSLIDFIVENLPLIIEVGIKLIVALAQGLVKAIPKIIDAIPKIISAIFDAFGKVDWGSIGKSIIDGLVAGLKAAKDLVVNTLKSIANGAIEVFKKIFGIKSPSRVFMNFGKNIDQGLAIGLDANLDKVEDSMDNLMNTVNFVPEGLDYELSGLNPSSPKSVSQINNTSSSTTNKNVNIYLTIERFENNREQDVEELMSEMEYIARKELIGNGGTA